MISSIDRGIERGLQTHPKVNQSIHCPSLFMLNKSKNVRYQIQYERGHTILSYYEANNSFLVV